MSYIMRYHVVYIQVTDSICKIDCDSTLLLVSSFLHPSFYVKSLEQPHCCLWKIHDGQQNHLIIFRTKNDV